MGETERVRAWLVAESGAYAGKRYLLGSTKTLVGRDPKSDIVIDGEGASVVSSRHAEILAVAGGYRLRDLNSTNGTYGDGKRVGECELRNGASIRLGPAGPEFSFELTEPRETELDKTIISPLHRSREQPMARPPATGSEEERLLAEAVEKARRVRKAGGLNQTMMIMREAMGAAVGRSRRKHRRIIFSLIVLLVAVSAFAMWRILDLRRQKSSIDQQIQAIEAKLEKGGLKTAEIEQLIEKLNGYQQQASRLQDSLFYRFGVEGREEAFIEREIRFLLKEFGAEQYSIPPEFTEQVQRYVIRYRTLDREHVSRMLGERRREIRQMQEIFRKENLPPDLVYMVLVESRFIEQSTSRKGAAGLWQFMPSTARAFGMKVDSGVDERQDLVKSTKAAARYIRNLILEFGAGSSVMLALAAYNAGPATVKRAVRKVRDPIKQRNFWYLYRTRALPVETRQYVPKIIAAIIVGRNLDKFGF